MKKIILGLVALGLFSFASELDKNAMQKYTIGNLENDSKNSVIKYIANTDGSVNVILDLNSNDWNLSPLENIKKNINILKNKKGIKKVFIDFDTTTVRDYKEMELLKKKLEFEKNRVNELVKISKINSEFTRNINEEFFRNKCIEFASNGFLGVFNKFDTNLCNKVKYTNGVIDFGDAVPFKYTKDFDEYLKAYMYGWNARVTEKYPKELKIKYPESDMQ